MADKRPTPDQVSYASPNPDGSMMQCGKCWKWIAGSRCVEVDGTVRDTDNCNYFVFGPIRPKSAGGLARKLSQVEAGLVHTPTSCNTCAAFTPTSNAGGTCGAVKDPNKDADATVEALGCCCHWMPA